MTRTCEVAQGSNSSPNYYSFFDSDNISCTDSLPEKDFINPHKLARLVDDTTVLKENMEYSPGLPKRFLSGAQKYVLYKVISVAPNDQ